MTAPQLRYIVPLSLVLACVIPANAGIQDRAAKPDAHRHETQTAARPSAANFEVEADKILSTSPQPGLIKMSAAFHSNGEFAHSYGSSLQPIIRHYWSHSGREAFLVSGSLDSAVVAVLRILMGEASPDSIDAPGSSTDGVWLHVSLGCSHSHPVSSVVEKVSVRGDSITLVYNRPHYDSTVAVTADFHPYLYWVSLGVLPAGTYTIRLLDTTKGSITFERAVAVQ